MQAEQQSELLPCPFCGHVTAPKMTDSYAFQDEIGGEFDESNAVYFAVVCDASKPNGPGGCGGMGGFAATESEAIALWQARAALSHPSTPQGWPCEVVEADFSENTITLQMKGADYLVSAGEYRLIPPEQGGKG